ncbi:DNA polymerase [Psychromonas hadalis]|uniref:DNA polymerase n=1 Tax=Psychromonas hadalis TaxID=211669 RepID=UPI00146DB9D9|nr:DNA polymerase [Psychromonas hadalis]
MADIADLLGLEKHEIKAPYCIEKMDEYLIGDKEAFEKYAIMDTVIAYQYFQKILQFTAENGLKGVPVTLGGLAIKAFKHHYKTHKLDRNLRADFGYIKVTREIYDDNPKGKSGYRTIKGDVLDPSRALAEQLFTDSFSGGWNDAFVAGPTKVDIWNDYDLPSAYPCGLINMRPLDYDNMFTTQEAELFRGDICGCARVTFSFPQSVRFPFLPVRAGNNSLIFPRTGEAYCTSYEIETALGLGAEIEVIQGVIVPFKKDTNGELEPYIFVDFMKMAREKREHYKRLGNEFDEKLWKELSNSIYGKTAQGLRAKTAFDVQVGYSKPIRPSDITSPYFAAMTTGFVRAVLGEIINSISSSFVVVSVTTDGFLTNATLDDMTLDGVMCRRFLESLKKISSAGGEILERKHQVRQLICMKTRGQLTVEPCEGEPAVLAKAGVQAPRHCEDQNQYMVDLYINRAVGQKHTIKVLTSSRDMFTQDKDMVGETVIKRMNLEPDYKRKLVNPRMVTLPDGREHIALDTVAFETIEERNFTRLRFDAWRMDNCLKTMSDWDEWSEMLIMHKAKKHLKIRLKAGEKSDSLLIRLFLRGYAKGEWGLDPKAMTLKACAEWFTSIGYPIKPNAISSAKKPCLIERGVPITKRTKKLLALLENKFPTFESENLFYLD